MCRHLAYLGPPVTLASLVLDPPHSLQRQSYEPREQNRGVVNADGFGVGWYAPSIRPEPARYRSTQPIWADSSFASLAPVVSSPAVVASVRSATPPNPVERSGVAPYGSGRWLFSHNGSVDGYRPAESASEATPGGVRRDMIEAVSAERLAAMDGATDSELLFAMILDELAGGAPPEEAVATTVTRVARMASARLNLLLTDGTVLFASAYGESLYMRQDGHSTLVASEPLDGDDAWEPVPDHTIIRATAGSTKASPL